MAGSKMNGIHNSKNGNLEKPFPGCLGRMVNLFDLSAGMPGNRLLTDKPHRDGSPLSRRSQSDVSRMGQFEDQIEDKIIVSELSRNSLNRKSNGTPMKMLIAQEMSKEIGSKHNPPSVVAKLMGLDTLPQQQPDLATERSHSKGYSRINSDTPLSYWQQDKALWNVQMQQEFHHYLQHNEYKDVFEIMQQSQKPNCMRDKSPHKVRYDEATSEEKMALVRQKFIEAKRLFTDEKLRQSQQFDDTVEVLSSNKDLLVKFLQEPNSMFSQHLYNLQSLCPPETKRITVLRPCKMVDNGFGLGKNKLIKKASVGSPMMGTETGYLGLSSPAVGWKFDDNPTQPTRIVVLKPSPGKPHDIKAVAAPLSASPGVLHKEEFTEEIEDDETQKSREVAKDITRQMQENLTGHRRDETLLSSVLSNGYIGDESSFHKSENDYATGNHSDSEVMSPTSRHSWDYVNRFDSPYSSSSFSRASYSPESSVNREGKKRISERWAMTASNGSCLEQRHVRRSSSTLGEMLALSDTKNATRSVEEGNKEDSKDSVSYVIGGLKDEDLDNSPRNLVRSKSVPVSSTVYVDRLNVDVSNQEGIKTEVLKEAAKSRSAKSSLKGKVSSLFFSRSKKHNKEKSTTSQSEDVSQHDSLPSGSPGGGTNKDRTKCLNDFSFEGCSPPSLHGSPGKTSSPNLSGQTNGFSPEAVLTFAIPMLSGNPSENQDQPSPISVLETQFEEDELTGTESSGNNKPERHGEFAINSKSNLIDKSPPIGSIARTLSWDDSCVDTATSYPLKSSSSPRGGAEEEEREWFFFVQTLLSVAGLDGEVLSDAFLARWHSSKSPLDPSLRDNYVDLSDKETLHEAKRRKKRSTRKLVFDCVNAALVDIAGYGSKTCQRAIPCTGPHRELFEGSSIKVVDQVWARMKEWFSGEERFVTGDFGDYSLVVEGVARKEVVGKGWVVEHLRLEMDNLGKEIEVKLLEDLVQEAVVELGGRV